MTRHSRVVKEDLNLIIIGLGGTGSRVYSPIYQYLSYLEEYAIKKVTLVDGDNFEAKNFIRQYALANHTQINKATAAADILSLQFPEILDKIKVIEDYSKSIKYLLDPHCLNIVISCVDNYKSRNLQITDILRYSGANTLYITPGNEYHNGQVISFLLFNEKLYGENPLELWENWNNPTDRIPRKGSCIDSSLSTPQLLAVNMMAAQVTLNTIVNFFHNGELNTYTLFDVFKNSTKVIDTIQVFNMPEQIEVA